MGVLERVQKVCSGHGFKYLISQHGMTRLKGEPLRDTSQQRQSYSSDLSVNEWQRLKPLVPAPKHGGRPAKYERLEILNAILYLVRTGCAWRLLPNDFPPWRIVYHYFSSWRHDGIWS